MLQPDPATLVRILSNIIQDRYEKGEIPHINPHGDLAHTCLAMFGFYPHQVAGIHTHLIGIGEGVWFRLKDDRVISACGEEADSDPALYDTAAN